MSASITKPRYFPGDHPALRARLDDYMRELSARLAAQPFAKDVAFLLLAGGYGRGEGGVFLSEGATPQLYNDLEFYLVLKNMRATNAARRWCAEEAHHGEEATGIEVEFKILGLAALQGAEPSMFYYDLLAAHVLVFGDESLLKNLPVRLRDPAQIPAHEATRLLFNRGTGLLFCRRALAENSERVRNGFIERNHAKARLAFADAVLALNGGYHFSCLVRSERLSEVLPQVPPNWPQLVAWHREAVDFKFRPRHKNPAPETLAARQAELLHAWSALFLWLESVRLVETFDDAQSYATHAGRLFPKTSIVHNALLHLRDRLRRGTPPRGWLDYPRAALQRALALLLQPRAESADTQIAASLLGLPADAALERVCGTYESWWRHYN